MEQVVVLSPDLGVKVADVVAAWDRDPECRKLGVARPAPPEPGRTMDPGLLASPEALVIAFATHVAMTEAYDHLKRLLANLEPVEAAAARHAVLENGIVFFYVRQEERRP